VSKQRVPRIVLFNLYAGGHHPQHLGCLAAYWDALRPEAELHVVISDWHESEHRDTVARISATWRTTVHVARLPTGFEDLLAKPVSRDRLHGRIAAQYARRLEADSFLFMAVDHAQLSLAVDLRFRRPVTLAGIYFRPSFHYPALGAPVQGLRERSNEALKKVVLRAALRNPHFRFLFSLDPFVVPYIARWARHTEVVQLPEPLEHFAPAGDATPLDGVDPHRRRLVIFGTLDERKGIGVVLDALESLPRDAQGRLALVLCGRAVGPSRDDLLARISTFAATSAVQLRLDDRFIPEADIQTLLQTCDLALLTYQRHVGSSGVLVRAASAGIPVLATDYGVVGEQVRRRRLGKAVDATDPRAVRDALVAWLDGEETIPFDPDAAAAFARENTAEAFAETIFSRLLPSRPGAGGSLG